MINVLRTKLFPHCHTTALFRKLRIYTVDWFYPEYCSHIQWLNVCVCVFIMSVLIMLQMHYHILKSIQ